VSMEGYVFLHRKILESDLWALTKEQVLVGIVCLLRARWSDGTVQGIPVQRGQWLTHYQEIKDACPGKITASQVRHAIKRLSSKEVTFISTRVVIHLGRRFLLITICKYEDYQTPNGEGVTRFDRRVSSRVSRGCHDNKIRKEKEKNKDKDKDTCSPSHKALVTRWNAEVADRYPRISSVARIGTTRRAHLKARYLESTFTENLDKMFEMIHASPKVTDGSMTFPKSKEPWTISFDWLIKNDLNYIKLLEGKYAKHRESDPYEELYDNPET
jgi:hypothetical protein